MEESMRESASRRREDHKQGILTKDGRCPSGLLGLIGLSTSGYTIPKFQIPSLNVSPKDIATRGPASKMTSGHLPT